MRNRSNRPRLLASLGKWRRILSPFFGVALLGVFLYWVWAYRHTILIIFQQIGVWQLLGMLALLGTSGLLTALAFVLLVRSKGYSFRFADGFHSLNYSQLASMIPGGIWGFAGLAGSLWSKGISKADSLLVIALNTIIMLTACAVVGMTGLAVTLGWGFALLSLLPFLILLFGRNQLNLLWARLFPESSHLPSASTLIVTLLLGVLVWMLASICFTWLLYATAGSGIVPFWTAAGAYATGYLGGYVTLLAPSGVGVSEGLVTVLLGPTVGAERILSIAVSFRIINTVIIWCNILITVVVTHQRKTTPPAT